MSLGMPLRQSINIGEGLGSYVLRLHWEPAESERVIWVDFELIEVTAMADSTNGLDGVPEYPKRGASSSLDTTPDIEQAEPAVEGFLKWDGCMQFTVAYVHMDTTQGLENLLDAIKQTRVHAAAAMGDAYDE